MTYCGLYCKLCSNVARIPKYATLLMETMRKGGWEHFGEYELEGFREFWNVLKRLSELDKAAPGCRGGCGPPDCEIRECAQRRGVITCAFCPDFPCEPLRLLNERYPVLIGNLERQREVGIDAWVEEQEELSRAGYCYDDITDSSTT